MAAPFAGPRKRAWTRGGRARERASDDLLHWLVEPAAPRPTVEADPSLLCPGPGFPRCGPGFRAFAGPFAAPRGAPVAAGRVPNGSRHSSVSPRPVGAAPTQPSDRPVRSRPQTSILRRNILSAHAGSVDRNSPCSSNPLRWLAGPNSALPSSSDWQRHRAAKGCTDGGLQAASFVALFCSAPSSEAVVGPPLPEESPEAAKPPPRTPPSLW